jgi:voltage-gated potassium channel
MFREFRYLLLIILFLFLSGSIGYSILEGWDLFDAIYMTIITLSTTGFQEIRPMSGAGRIFTMILIVFGISILFYVLGRLNVAIFEGNLFRGRKMQRKINNLENHYIICGFGRIGKKICQELERRNKHFVIIENDKERVELCKEYLHIYGDGTEDENLLNAGIERAWGLVSVLESDVQNVFAVLSARGLNGKLKIIARAEEESSREKLLKAGADRVILPSEIGGFRITQALLKPTVLEYFDELFSRSELGLEIEEIKISEGASIIDKSLAESGIRGKLNIIIIGIYREGGEWIYNPRSETKLHLDDTLIVIGETNELQQLQEITKDFSL